MLVQRRAKGASDSAGRSASASAATPSGELNPPSVALTFVSSPYGFVEMQGQRDAVASHASTQGLGVVALSPQSFFAGQSAQPVARRAYSWSHRGMLRCAIHCFVVSECNGTKGRAGRVRGKGSDSLGVAE